MPKLPRGATQQQVIETLVRAGGQHDPKHGKGGHQAVLMPNGHTTFVKTGIIPVGELSAIIRQAGLKSNEFLKHWRG